MQKGTVQHLKWHFPFGRKEKNQIFSKNHKGIALTVQNWQTQLANFLFQWNVH